MVATACHGPAGSPDVERLILPWVQSRYSEPFGCSAGAGLLQFVFAAAFACSGRHGPPGESATCTSEPSPPLGGRGTNGGRGTGGGQWPHPGPPPRGWQHAKVLTALQLVPPSVPLTPDPMCHMAYLYPSEAFVNASGAGL